MPKLLSDEYLEQLVEDYHEVAFDSWGTIQELADVRGEEYSKTYYAVTVARSRGLLPLGDGPGWRKGRPRKDMLLEREWPVDMEEADEDLIARAIAGKVSARNVCSTPPVHEPELLSLDLAVFKSDSRVGGVRQRVDRWRVGR